MEVLVVLYPGANTRVPSLKMTPVSSLVHSALRHTEQAQRWAIQSVLNAAVGVVGIEPVTPMNTNLCTLSNLSFSVVCSTLVHLTLSPCTPLQVILIMQNCIAA